MTFIPQVGKLYQFKDKDSIRLLNKYKHYYVGLALCVIADVIKDISEDSLPEDTKQYIKSNPIYGFETYNCIQYYSDLLPEGIKVSDMLFLTFNEVNDMLEPARAD